MKPSGPRGPANPASMGPPPSGTGARSAAPPDQPRRGATEETMYGSLIGDIMIRDVVTVPPGATLRTAALLLSRKRISGMPVVEEDGNVLGVLSEKDIVRALQQRGGLGLPGGLFDLLLETSEARQKDMLTRGQRVLDQTAVREVMTSPALTVRPTTPTVEAMRTMFSQHVNRLPVVENRRLVGIVTRRDVLSVHLGPV
jgi:CBS domain-containing protein